MRIPIGLALLVVAVLSFVPVAAHAQTASIAGVVRDTSGAVLPGVTVEASSPALIEKVRTVTTDGAGAYQIVNLRPGTYSVTFTLQGFATIKREAAVADDLPRLADDPGHVVKAVVEVRAPERGDAA
jgi:hypothetical protein